MEKTMASSTTQWILELVDKITGPMRKATDTAEDMTRTVDETTESVDNLGKMAEETGGVLEKWGKSMFFLNQLKDGVDTITDAFDDAIEPGVKFQTAVADMAGITNLAGKELDMLSDKARGTAKAFGTDAADATDLYTNLLSKLSPTLKAAPESLQVMADNVMTMSKTMRGDVPGATAAMVAAMNQFQVSLDDPIKAASIMTDFMNIMAAGAVEGSASVTKVSDALTVVGFTAHNAGISFAETNSAIQMLDKLGKTGSEGGTILRNIISRLDVQTSDANKQLIAAKVNIKQLHDHTIPLTNRLKALEPVLGNASLMQAIFGEEAKGTAAALIQNSRQVDTWTEAIQGTSSATDMATKQMDTYAERMKRTQAWVNDLKISFFELVEPFAPLIKWTGVAVGALVTLGMVGWSIGNIMQLAALKTSAIWVASMVKMAVTTVLQSRIMTVAIYSIPIIGWILAIIGAITALVAYFYNTSEKFRAFLFGLWEVIKTTFIEYYKFLYNVMSAVIQVLNPANWFDDNFSFKGVWDNLVKETYEGGKRVGEAWEVGKQKGHESWANRNKTEESSTMVIPMLNEKSQLKTDNGSGKGGYGNANGGKQGNVGLGGSGSGSTRNITMNVTMNNNFSVSGEVDYRKISERIKRELVAILSDVAPVAG